jgi:hypothetical protein
LEAQSTTIVNAIEVEESAEFPAFPMILELMHQPLRFVSLFELQRSVGIDASDFERTTN